MSFDGNSHGAVESAFLRLYARYVDATWRRDSKAFGGCFAEDAIWEIVGQRFIGRRNIEKGIINFLRASQRVLIKPGNPLLILDGGMISAETMISELIKTRHGEGRATVGTYTDELKPCGDRLLFQTHSFELHYAGPLNGL